nr:fructose-bisphosphatase class III [uncultured Clostridium sp.]
MYKKVKLLSKQYPSIAAALTEIINLEAILNPYYNLRDDEEICFNSNKY